MKKDSKYIELTKGQQCFLAIKNIVTIQLAQGKPRSQINQELLAWNEILFGEYLRLEALGRTKRIMKGID